MKPFHYRPTLPLFCKPFDKNENLRFGSVSKLTGYQFAVWHLYSCGDVLLATAGNVNK